MTPCCRMSHPVGHQPHNEKDTRPSEPISCKQLIITVDLQRIGPISENSFSSKGSSKVEQIHPKHFKTYYISEKNLWYRTIGKTMKTNFSKTIHPIVLKIKYVM